MLEQLHIRNLATIESLSLEFEADLTVLSGETGAGKSILIDALGLVLGTRADPALVRAGAERADISACFHVAPHSAAARWLADHALIDDVESEQCLIRRVLNAEGRTKAFVNGTATPTGKLRELGEHLVEVFGQNESQSLRRADAQRELLDGYARHASLLQQVREQAQAWQQLQTQIDRLRAAAARDPAELDLLRHQVRELAALNLQPGEFAEIEAEHRQLANAGQLLQDGGRAQDRLYGADGAIHDQLSEVAGLLGDLAPLHEAFAETENLVSSARELVRDAAAGLRRVLERMDLDPERLAAVEARMADIHELARKHRLRAEELPARLDHLRDELERAEAAGGDVDALLQRQAEALAAYRDSAARLSASRREHAARHAEAVTARVRELGMPHAEFRVVVEPAERPRPHPAGEDDIRFDFSANPGQPPRPLSKVASGGELSRISLAIQVVAQEADGAPTMIFDEVDAGIGGAVAESVGRQLRALGMHRQVLCVTHLGQVAACGQQHYAVSKEVRADQTFTAVQALEGKNRISELARMIGGRTTTAATESMARELLKLARATD